MEFTVHVYHHIVPGSADPRLDRLIALIEGTLLMKVQDIIDKLALTRADVERETTVINASIAKTNGDAAVIADLKKQLADAIAALAAAGADTTALQSIGDQLDTFHTTMTANADADAAALVANT